jgi:hypothetical protein
VAHPCNPSYLEGGDKRKAVQGQLGQKLARNPMTNKLKAVRLGRDADQMVECLPNKGEVLN